ncbi:MoaD/ThiS family protein [uncultured Corynebacterium sp.]|uniref:MoaD/ThiS family protein n=1 Tax=uncultured Corynebacterium sp. TaxID=159447 RepID=UPI0025EB5E51|nr:MoaD/ThiS family protein [uncultured Corynebacterium sp.]
MDIHYFAAARAARGLDRETIAPQEGTLSDLLERLGAENTDTTTAGMSLAQVFDRCTFLIDGRSAEPAAPLAGATRVDVLPPFAGG